MSNSNTGKKMTRTDMLTAIAELKMRMGREVNTTDFPPHMREQMRRLFGSDDRAIALARAANVTPAQIKAYRVEFAEEVERFINWNVASTIGMPDNLKVKEFGRPSTINSAIMPDERQRTEFREMAERSGISKRYRDDR